jgi:hypothetical protein
MSAPAANKSLISAFTPRIVERHILFVLVEIVLRLLQHGEGAGQCHLDRAFGIGAQKFHVTDFDWILAPYLAHDARHSIGMAGAVERSARIFDIDAFKRGGEAVGHAAAAPSRAMKSRRFPWSPP